MEQLLSMLSLYDEFLTQKGSLGKRNTKTAIINLLLCKYIYLLGTQLFRLLFITFLSTSPKYLVAM